MARIDELNFIEIDGVTCCRGHAFPFGATLSGNGGINFSINSVDAEGCELVLYHQGAEEAFAHIPVPDATPRKKVCVSTRTHHCWIRTPS